MESRPLCVNYDAEGSVWMIIRSYFVQGVDAAVFNIRAVHSERSSTVQNHPFEYGIDSFLASADLRMLSHMISTVGCFRDGALSRLWEFRAAGAIESVKSNYLYLLQPSHGSGRRRGGFRFDIDFNVERCFVEAVWSMRAALPYGLRQRTGELRFYVELEVGRAAVVSSEKLERMKYEDGGLIREKDCAICFGEYESDGEELALMPCSHSFHYHCVAKWLKMRSSCPLCRQQINYSAS